MLNLIDKILNWLAYCLLSAALALLLFEIGFLIFLSF